jgi:DNA-binding GntR family transcriptional regulator
MERPQTAANGVREAITEGSFVTGAFLGQAELAEQYGSSRAPIPDGLRQLEADGLVPIHPTRTVYAAEIGAPKRSEITAVRELPAVETLPLVPSTVAYEKLDQPSAVLADIDDEPNAARWAAWAAHSIVRFIVHGKADVYLRWLRPAQCSGMLCLYCLVQS